MKEIKDISEVQTWEDYKTYAKAQDPETKAMIEEAEQMAAIMSAIIRRRDELGISQRELARLCGLPQSSVARIETYKTTPKLSTLLKMMQPLGLRLDVSLATQ